jgi:hypothetical protein
VSSDIQFVVEFDDNSVMKINQPIDNERIKGAVSKIESVLLENGAKPRKVKDIFEISVEMLQNILFYAYGSRENGDSKQEADGTFKVIYDSQNDTYTMISENIITSKQKEKILERVDGLDKLDEKEIRKLIREKMRSRDKQHEKGAGLGFLVMARKSIEPLGIKFTEIFKGLEKFTFTVKA